MPRRPLVLAVLVAVSVATAGCNDDPEPVPVENRTIGLRLDEYRIMPQAVEAPAGQLRLIMRNIGKLPHNVAVETIPELGSDEAPERIALTGTVHATHRTEVTFDAAPGTYRLVCTIQNHDDLGQVGTLVVR
jgi:plastocyanin